MKICYRHIQGLWWVTCGIRRIQFNCLMSVGTAITINYLYCVHTSQPQVGPRVLVNQETWGEDAWKMLSLFVKHVFSCLTSSRCLASSRFCCLCSLAFLRHLDLSPKGDSFIFWPFMSPVNWLIICAFTWCQKEKNGECVE